MQCTMLATEETIMRKWIPTLPSFYLKSWKKDCLEGRTIKWTITIIHEVYLEYLEESPNLSSDDYESFLTLMIFWLGSNFPTWSFRNAAFTWLESPRDTLLRQSTLPHSLNLISKSVLHKSFFLFCERRFCQTFSLHQ